MPPAPSGLAGLAGKKKDLENSDFYCSWKRTCMAIPRLALSSIDADPGAFVRAMTETVWPMLTQGGVRIRDPIVKERLNALWSAVRASWYSRT